MIKHTKKIIFFIIVIFILIIIAISNSTMPQKPLDIHPIVQEYLKAEHLEKCYITSMDNTSDISYTMKKQYANNKEIQKYIDLQLETYGVSKITKDFLQQFYQLQTKEQFYEYAKKMVINQKELNEYAKIKKTIEDTLITRADFKLDKEQVSEFSILVVNEYEELAYSCGMDISTYATKVLNMDYNTTFFEHCYDKGSKYVKMYLIIGYLAQNQKISHANGDNIYDKYGYLHDKIISNYYIQEDGFLKE